VSRLTVLTWNMQGLRPARAGLPAVLDQFDPDLLLLVEARPDDLLAEPALAPWSERSYMDAVAGSPPGMAILSRLPMRDATTLTADRLRTTDGTWDRPRAVTARIQTASGATLLATAVHTKAPLPFPPLNAARRNRQFASLAGWIAVQLAEGERLIVAGDFNAVRCHFPRMTDVAVALGREAPTWRPIGIRKLPAVLRLDRIFVSTGITPVAVAVGCSVSRSDHCPVGAVVEV
jgi:endonuclease/exonuclease/phosphatase family metal-dependent hydrolase